MIARMSIKFPLSVVARKGCFKVSVSKIFPPNKGSRGCYENLIFQKGRNASTIVTSIAKKSLQDSSNISKQVIDSKSHKIIYKQSRVSNETIYDDIPELGSSDYLEWQKKFSKTAKRIADVLKRNCIEAQDR